MSVHRTVQAFNQTLLETLDNFRNPTWLGEKSPLAAPYILGRQLSSQVESPQARGKVLQDVIKKATAQLEGKNARRSRAILEELYFKGRPVREVCSHADVMLSRSSLYESRNEAIDELAVILARELQPALALEAPPRLVGELYGYGEIAHTCLDALRNADTVAISGMGGMGKTTVGSYIAHTWGAKHTCWYTIRSGFTDHLGMLLRHLGYHFHQQGNPLLWQQMIASENRIDMPIVLGLLRYSLEQARQRPLLLCIDEVDLLRPAESGEHAQIVTFLRSVSGTMPLLLLGQRIAFDVDQHFELSGIKRDIVRQWLHQAGLRLGNDEFYHLWDYTHGSPQLVSLFVTMQQVGESLPAVLDHLSAAPSVEDLLGRIMVRLSDSERSVLFALAVMQGPAPRDAWQQSPDAGALHMLAERRLIQSDEYGGVWLLPVFAQLLMNIAPQEQLAALHLNAARIFAERSYYTVAAHHLAAAGQPLDALALWREQREQQIDQGQAYAALQIFRPMLALPWDDTVGEELRLTCVRLEQLLGQAAQALEDLRSIAWRTPLLSVEADELTGEIANEQGDFANASQAFTEGIKVAEQLLEVRIARMHKGRAWAYLRVKDRDHAWTEVQRAAYEVENFKGLLQEEEYCDYTAAERHYVAALELARDLDHVQGLAKTNANLSGLYARLGRFELALQHWHDADASYRHLGKTRAVAGCKLNLSFLYILAGEYQLAFEAAQQVERYLAERDVETPPGLRALIHQGMAEASLGLGNLAAAEGYAQAALNSTEQRTLPDTQRTLAEIQLALGNLDAARLYVDKALSIAQAHEDRYLEAYAWRVAASICIGCDDTEGAAFSVARASKLFAELGLAHEVEKTQSII